MKLLVWKLQNMAWPNVAKERQQKRQKRQVSYITNRFNRLSTFLPSFSFHSSEIRARGFSGGDWRFPRLFFFLEIALDPAIGAASEISSHVSLPVRVFCCDVTCICDDAVTNVPSFIPADI